MTQRQHPIGTDSPPRRPPTTSSVASTSPARTSSSPAATAGSGLETTRALAKAGAAVTVGARDPDRAAVALAGIEGVEVARLDLVDPTSIDAFSDPLPRGLRPLRSHILINNAGHRSRPAGSATHAATNRSSRP